MNLAQLRIQIFHFEVKELREQNTELKINIKIN